MELLIYYSHNHKCYRTKYGHTYGKEIGDRNGFDEELMLVTSSEGFTLSFRERFIRFLKKMVYRLETPKRK